MPPPQSNAKSFKRSFEDVAHSPTHTLKPKMFLNAVKETYCRMMEIGHKIGKASHKGGSPQASSTSSKGFSNRSSNVSQGPK